VNFTCADLSRIFGRSPSARSRHAHQPHDTPGIGIVFDLDERRLLLGLQRGRGADKQSRKLFGQRQGRYVTRSAGGSTSHSCRLVLPSLLVRNRLTKDTPRSQVPASLAILSSHPGKYPSLCQGFPDSHAEKPDCRSSAVEQTLPSTFKARGAQLSRWTTKGGKYVKRPSSNHLHLYGPSRDRFGTKSCTFQPGGCAGP
jgi:hypothetical protein